MNRPWLLARISKGRPVYAPIACALLMLIAPTEVSAEIDFSGTYELLPFNGQPVDDEQYLPIERANEGEWRVRVPLPPELEDERLTKPWGTMEGEELKRLFADGAPLHQIECIAPKPISVGPIFCSVPTGTALVFRPNGSSWPPHVSSTGYLLAFGSPAGLHSFELRKLPSAGGK